MINLGVNYMIHSPNISKEVLKAIFSRIDEGIHVVDIEGKTIFYNEVAAKHDGLTVEEVVGRPLLDVFPSLNESTSTLLKVLITKKAIYNQSQSYLNVHGKQIETVNTTMPIFVVDVFVGAMEIAKDYTSLKVLSEQLIDLQKKWSINKKTIKRKHPMTYSLNDFLTVHPPLERIKMEALKLANSSSPVLVFGESGTGKEVFVQGIHHASRRSEQPFIAQNCAAIPETLLESILFGTSKGSYTGAVERPGLFELAHGGTLFLDEIHAMPIDLQAKLLRVLEDGMIRRVGGIKDTFIDVRVMTAMNVHPTKALEKEMIRPDLFYRLNVLTYELSPLRERTEDILYLANFFIKEFNEKLNKGIKGFENDLKAILLSYKWPGNVRELKHTLEYMINICDDEQLTVTHLPIMLREYIGSNNSKNKKDLEYNIPFRLRIESYEKELIQRALMKTDGNINQTAKILQIPRQTLQYKLQKYTISK